MSFLYFSLEKNKQSQKFLKITLKTVSRPYLPHLPGPTCTFFPALPAPISRPYLPHLPGPTCGYFPALSANSSYLYLSFFHRKHNSRVMKNIYIYIYIQCNSMYTETLLVVYFFFIHIILLLSLLQSYTPEGM